MRVLDDALWLCQDCVSAAVNDDYTGLDYYLEEPEATRRMKQIKRGLHNLGPGLVPSYDEDEFSRTPCDCCGTNLAGYRMNFHILG